MIFNGLFRALGIAAVPHGFCSSADASSWSSGRSSWPTAIANGSSFP